LLADFDAALKGGDFEAFAGRPPLLAIGDEEVVFDAGQVFCLENPVATLLAFYREISYNGREMGAVPESPLKSI